MACSYGGSVGSKLFSTLFLFFNLPLVAVADDFSAQCTTLLRQVGAECPAKLDSSTNESGLLAYNFANCPADSALKKARLEMRDEVQPKPENNLPKHASCEIVEERMSPKIGKWGMPMKATRTVRIRRFNRSDIGAGTVVTRELVYKSEEGGQWWYDVRGGTVVCLSHGEDNFTQCFDYDREEKKFRVLGLLGPYVISTLVNGSKSIEDVSPRIDHFNTPADARVIGLAIPQ